MRPFVARLLFFAMLPHAEAESNLADKFPEARTAASFIEQFPTLAKFLALDHPWQLSPGVLVARIFPAEVKLVQGSEEYPLLFDGQRSTNWPGLTGKLIGGVELVQTFCDVVQVVIVTVRFGIHRHQLGEGIGRWRGIRCREPQP